MIPLGRHCYRVGVICPCPSVQMSAQYDALADLPEFEFTMLFRRSEQGNPAWKPQCPQKIASAFLPPSRLPLLGRRLVRHVNGSIRPLLDRFDFDAIILHGIYDSTAVWQALRWCRWRGRPYLLRCDANIAKERSVLRRAVRRMLGGRNVCGAAGLLYIGTQNRRYYQMLGGRNEQFFLAPWEIDYGNLDAWHLDALAKKDMNRRELGAEELLVVTVGRVLELKGYNTLVPALANLRGQGMSIRLVVVGDGPYISKLREMTTNANLPATLCGNRDRREIVNILTACDVFVLASQREAWGLVVNEAALCSLPLVLSDAVGAGPDLVHAGCNGEIFHRGDGQHLREILLPLVRDESLRKAMGRCSREILLNWRQSHPAREGYLRALRYALGLDKPHDLRGTNA